MATRGSVWKRCTHDGKTRDTGLPATNRRPAVPACRCKGGSWWWRIDAGKDPVTGARRQPIQGGYPTRAAAEEGLDDMRDQLRRGVIAHDRGQTVADWLTTWLNNPEHRWEPTTRDGYTRDINTYLIPHLGHIRLRDLQRLHVAAMLAKLGERDDTRTDRKGMHGGSVVPQRSPSTIDKVRRTLRSALGAAVEDGLIGHNPAAGRFRATRGRTAGTREVAWWQPHELRAFLDHVTDDPDVALWTVAALTGLRRSELLGLRWTDLELDAQPPGLYVKQRCSGLAGPHPCAMCGKNHQGRVLRPGAKSPAGYRWVPLVRLVVTELRAHKRHQDAIRADLGDHWSEHALVFPIMEATRRSRNLPGSPRLPDDLTKRHAELVLSAGLPKVVLHEMRHGAISMLSTEMPADQIALIVGHSTEEVTKAIYTHGIKVRLGEGAERAAGLLHPRTGDDTGHP